MELIRNLPRGQVMMLAEQVALRQDTVSNLTMVSRPGLTLCLMSLAAGEEIGTHSAPGDALVQILDGSGVITLDGKDLAVQTGQALLMPAGVPHSLRSDRGMKVYLTLVTGEGKK